MSLLSDFVPRGLAKGYQEINSSTSWPVPLEATWVYVELVAGGASGGASVGGSGNLARATGGGGGAFVDGLFRAADLPSSVAITIGAGGAAATANSTTGSVSGNDGGDSKFGSLLTARGGRRGAAFPEYSSVYPSGGSIGVKTGGAIANMNFSLSGPTSGAGGTTINGDGCDGGNAVRGGAGGGGVYSNTYVGSGGVSDNDGNGGNAAFSTSATVNAIAGDGQFPGGGGGAAAASAAATGATIRRSGKGGNGRARIYWW